MKKIMIATALLIVFNACKKNDDGDNNNNPPSSNTLKVLKGGGGATVNVTFTSKTCGVETTAQGTSYSFRGFFSVGANSTYDRLAIGFKSEPNAASYAITVQQYYPNLPADKAGVNITYDSYNYVVTGGNIVVSVENGKKKYEFNNLVLDAGVAIPGTAGTRLPGGSVISGSVLCN